MSCRPLTGPRCPRQHLPRRSPVAEYRCASSARQCGQRLDVGRAERLVDTALPLARPLDDVAGCLRRQRRRPVAHAPADRPVRRTHARPARPQLDGVHRSGLGRHDLDGDRTRGRPVAQRCRAASGRPAASSRWWPTTGAPAHRSVPRRVRRPRSAPRTRRGSPARRDRRWHGRRHRRPRPAAGRRPRRTMSIALRHAARSPASSQRPPAATSGTSSGGCGSTAAATSIQRSRTGRVGQPQPHSPTGAARRRLLLAGGAPRRRRPRCGGRPAAAPSATRWCGAA